MSSNTTAAQALASLPKPKKFKLGYSELDEKQLDKFATRLGFSKKANGMGYEILKFYLSLIQPQFFMPEQAANVRNAEKEAFKQFALPMFLYHEFDAMFNEKLMRYKKVFEEKDGDKELDIPQTNMLRIMPEWYMEYLEQFADAQLTNQYIMWVLENYYRFTHERPEAKKYWDQKLPWLRAERKKYEYVKRRIENRLFEIRNEGLRNQSDLLFLYILRLVATNNVILSKLFPANAIEAVLQNDGVSQERFSTSKTSSYSGVQSFLNSAINTSKTYATSITDTDWRKYFFPTDIATNLPFNNPIRKFK